MKREKKITREQRKKVKQKSCMDVLTTVRNANDIEKTE